jgi:tetratricopeptide (TPR) repeat protein
VAEWYEQAYNKDLSGSYPLLAYHWRNAANYGRTVDYLEKAAEVALRNNANREAIRFLNEALALQGQLTEKVTPLRLARWYRQLGQANMGLGLMQDGQHCYEKVLALLGFPVPVTVTQIGGRLLWQVIRQVGHRLRPQLYLREQQTTPAGDDTHQAILAEAARAYQELILIYYLQNNLPPFLHAILASLNLAERANAPRELAEGYATMCVVAGAIPQLNLAPIYEPRALQAAERLNNDALWGFVLLRIGTYKASVGLWEGAHEATEQAIARYEHINDPRGVGDAVNVLGILLELEGRFAEAHQAFDDLYRLGQKHENIQHEGWGLGGVASALLLLGQTEEAIVKADAALERIEVGSVQQVNDTAVKAAALLRLGHVTEAVAAADQALGLMKGVTPTAFTVIPYLQLAMVYLLVWESSQSATQPSALSPQSAVLKKQAWQTIKVLHRFNIGKAAAWLCQGWYEQLRGRTPQAMKLWQKGLDAAAGLKTPYEEGLLHYHISRHLPAHDPARAAHLAQAHTLFTRLETTHELALLELF